MDMAKIKLTQLSQHGDLLDRYGARIRILGQRNLMKADVLEAMDKACQMTSHNNRTVLNVCFPYTSRDEITTAIRRTVSEYSKPVAQPGSESSRRSPFTEERIVNTIKSQHKAEGDADRPMQHVEPRTHSPSQSSTSLSSDVLALSSEEPEDPQEGEADADDSSVSSSTTTLQHEALSPASTSSPPTSYTGSPPSKPLTMKTNTSTSAPSSYQSPESITSNTITSHLFTASDPPLDLLIRTSGVQRLSDFMLWQCHQDTRIIFLDVLWPEFDLWQFLPVLWEWQWRGRKEEQLERMIMEGKIE